MRMLVLGGTWFLGRAVVTAALGHGHEVVTFNRGRTDKDVDGVETIRGDRSSAEDVVRVVSAGPYDVVIDPSGYVPSDVAHAAAALSEAAERYLFVSSVDAYEDWPARPVSEDSPLHQAAAGSGWGELPYGHLKAGCEERLRQTWPGTLAVIRPGVVLGPREPKGRLPWWLRRIHEGGRVLAPGDPDRPIQPIDVRDVAAFVVNLAERQVAGAVNVAAPTGHITMRGLLEACSAVTGSRPDLVWAGDDVLEAAGVKDWTELPMWRPAAGTWQMDTAQASGFGLVCRPIVETIAATWEWLQSGQRVAEHWRTAEHGIDPGKEQRIIAGLR
jgi:2'-hydroxyisoflavone reductase